MSELPLSEAEQIHIARRAFTSLCVAKAMRTIKDGAVRDVIVAEARERIRDKIDRALDASTWSLRSILTEVLKEEIESAIRAMKLRFEVTVVDGRVDGRDDGRWVADD